MLELHPANAYGFPSLGTKGRGREAVCLGRVLSSPTVSEEFGHASGVELGWGDGPTAQPGAIEALTCE